MRPFLWLTVTLFLTCVPGDAGATAQEPDRLIYMGKEYCLAVNPLEKFFENNPGMLPENPGLSTNLWRGYIATFQIAGDVLYLKEIELRDRDHEGSVAFRSVLDKVFPDSDGVVPMTWYTGIMLAPYGELVSYVHMGYASQYSNYLLIAVKDGVVTMCKDMTLSQLEEFKARQFQKFKATRQYREIYRRLKKILRKTGGKKIWAEEIHHIDDLIEANIFDNINELL